jgi:hypothetical protein
MSAARAFDTYDLPDFVVGNTWAGIPLYTVTPAPSGVLTEVEIEFRTGSPASPAYVAKISASEGDITIVSGQWSFIVPQQVLPLPAGTFYQSIKLYDNSTPKKPYTYTVGTITGTLPSTR